MSVTRRAARRAAIATAAVLVLGGLTACSASGTPDSTPTAVTPESLWDTAAVHSLSLDISPDDSDAIIAAYRDTGEKTTARATVTIDGTSLDDVGVSIAGEPELDPEATETDLAGLPWLIRLDEFVEGQNVDGETELLLSANASSTALNESVALDLQAVAGLATQSAVSTRFTVNGGTPRLRLIVQNLGDEWIADQFDSADSLFVPRADGDYEYRGDSADAYAGVIDEVVGDAGTDRLANFLRFVDRSSDAAFAGKLNTWLDIDSFAAYLAFQKLVTGNGGPNARTALEYSSSSKVMVMVAWDFSTAFETSTVEGATDGPVPATLTKRFLAVPEFAEVYDQAVLDISSTLYDTGTAETFLDDRAAPLKQQATDLVPRAEINRESKALERKILARTP